MSTAPSGESRVGPLASSACCAPASSPPFNFCAAIETAQERRINSLRTMQSADPEPREAARWEPSPRPVFPSGRSPATSRRRLPAPAACARAQASVPCRRQERACKIQKSGVQKVAVPAIPAARQSRRWSASSAYSPRPPSAARGQARRAYRNRELKRRQAGTQFVPGMRAYSAHNRLHVNAPTLCRFAQSYMINKVDCDAQRRTRPLSRTATPVSSPARGPTSKAGMGEEAGMQFVPRMRAYSAHNRLHVNAPAPCRFAQSYMIHDHFGVRTDVNSPVSDVSWSKAMRVRR